MSRINTLAAIVLALTTGCELPDGVSVGGQVCLGDFIEIGNGGVGVDICVEIGNGNMIGSPIVEDGLMIEMINLYGEQVDTNPEYAISNVSLYCEIEDEDRNSIPATPYVYTDGVTVLVYLPNVPSHFEATCQGTVQLAGGGPGYVLFEDDGTVVTEVTMILWEDEVIDDGDWRERNGELDIDRD